MQFSAKKKKKKKNKRDNLDHQAIKQVFSRRQLQLTWKLPWLASMQIHLHHCSLRASLIGHLVVQIVAYQLLIAWMEPETWR